MEVIKKSSPEFFSKYKSGKRCAEARLADFDLRSGDTILLKEYNSKTKKFTGRELRRKCRVASRFSPLKHYSMAQLKKHGLYVIEFEKG